MKLTEVTIHATAEVSDKAKIGKGTKVWNQSQVRENTVIGSNCIISKNVYIDCGVKIGNNVKVQNNVSIYDGVEVDDGVFIGPHVVFTNDKNPRAINIDGTLKTGSDWQISKTYIKKGASIGAGAVILCGITLGEYSLIGAGSVVTKDVASYSVVVGNPAKHVGYVCKCAKLLKPDTFCKECGCSYNQVCTPDGK